MTVVLMDGFDYYSVASINDTSRGWIPSNSIAQAFVTGRLGTGLALVLQSRSVARALPAAITTGFFGAAIYLTSDGQRLSMLDGTSIQIEARYDQTNQRFQLYRGATIIASGPAGSIAQNAWMYLELSATIDPTTGSAELKVNGQSHVTFSGNTRSTANSSFNQVGFNNPTSAVQMFVDDVYVCDSAGGAPTNTYLGDVIVQGRVPSGNGNSSQFVGSDGNSTDNYLLVDEIPPNGDTDYVESGTVNDKDTYAFQDLIPTAGTVFAVQPVLSAKKTDAGIRSIKTVTRLSATEVLSAEKFLSTSYAYYDEIQEAKPGGGAWSITDFNNAEFGVQVIT